MAVAEPGEPIKLLVHGKKPFILMGHLRAMAVRKLSAKKRLKKWRNRLSFSCSWAVRFIGVPHGKFIYKTFLVHGSIYFINCGASRSLSAHLRHSGETPRSGSVCAYFQRGHNYIIKVNINKIYKHI